VRPVTSRRAAVVPAGWGILIAADHDQVAGAARAESLGLDHVVLAGAPAAVVLMALGATRHITLLVEDPDNVSAFLSPGCHRAQVDRLGSAAAVRRLVRVRVEPHPRSSAYKTDTVGDIVGPIERCIERLTRLRTSVPAGTLCVDGPCGSLDQLVLDGLSPSPELRARAPLFAEDLREGERFELGTYTPSAEEIVAFGLQWDPLDLHIDPDLARETPMGRLIASGIHSQAIMQRLSARSFMRHLQVVGGRAMLGSRMYEPVLPGMTLAAHVEVLSVRLRPHGRAVVTARWSLTHQDRTIAVMEGETIVEQRTGADASSVTRTT
jgi:acyl dehydratase